MFIFLDTETTGAGPDDRLCQLAFKAGQGRGVCGLFNPGRPIAIEAMAVHHITNEMVKNRPPFKQILIPRMPFGKHQGALFSEIPADYLQWLPGTDLDGDMAYTVRYHLGQAGNV